jgi:hypothetical protein
MMGPGFLKRLYQKWYIVRSVKWGRRWIFWATRVLSIRGHSLMNWRRNLSPMNFRRQLCKCTLRQILVLGRIHLVQNPTRTALWWYYSISSLVCAPSRTKPPWQWY